MACQPVCCRGTESASSEMSDSSTTNAHPPVVILTYISSVIHTILAVMCIVLGVLSSWKSEIWMAHRVSPIWSGVFFLLTAGFGATAARKRTAYLVMCYGALCVVSMVVGVVCIQLLKRGLVTHLSDGATHRQEELEMKVILAMATCGLEIFICIMSFPICCQLAAKVKEEVHLKRDGTFSIQILGDKDILIQQSVSTSYERLYEDDTVSDLARLATKGDCSNLLIATAGMMSSTPPTQPKIATPSKQRLDFTAAVKMTKISKIPSVEEPSVSSKTDCNVERSLDDISGVV